MKTFSMVQEFGTFLAEGRRAAEFKHSVVDPLLLTAEEIVFDFSGVRNASSSFMNALFANLVANNDDQIIKRVRFTGCNPTIQFLLQDAVEIGMQRPTNFRS